MKGLLIKDYKLMRSQNRFFIVVILVGIAMTLIGYDYTFITSYLSFVCSMFVLSTISYDEFDNGYAFLFTLPFKRNTYVKEKYVFGLITSGLAWLFGVVITTAFQLITHTPDFSMIDWLIAELMLMPALWVVLAVMIPCQLKFGGEKSRIAIFGAVGAAVVIGIVIVRICDFLQIDLAAVLNALPSMGIGTITVLLILIALIVLLISEKISEKIMAAKEF